MTHEKANEIFGPVCFSTDEYEVRAKVEDDGLHVVALRRVNGQTQIPLGFMLGSSALRMERKTKEQR